jgi:hypothetical protein|nr:MAG TPA: hypothetical protein [Caudoviricetes sp.]
MEDKKQYIYLGDTLEFKDIRLTKGVIYYSNEAIEEKLEKYPLLKKTLVDINQASEALKNEKLLETVTQQIKDQIREEAE